MTRPPSPRGYGATGPAPPKADPVQPPTFRQASRSLTRRAPPPQGYDFRLSAEYLTHRAPAYAKGLRRGEPLKAEQPEPKAKSRRKPAPRPIRKAKPPTFRRVRNGLTRPRIKSGARRGRPLNASLAAALYVHRARVRKEPAGPAFERWKIASVVHDSMLRPKKHIPDARRFAKMPTDPVKHTGKRTHNEGPGRQIIKWWLLDYDLEPDW